MSSRESEWLEINWDEGTPEVSLLSVIIAVVFGLPLMLSNPQFLTIPSITFYLLLFIIGFFGHIDDITKEGYTRINKDSIARAVALGLLGYLVIQLMFFMGLTLLATSETAIKMDKWQLLIYNLAFVIPAEELVFRDSLPFILSQGLGRAINEKLAVAIAFVISAISFGALHIWTYGFNSIAVLKAIVSGVILGVVRILGGLLASYISHAMYNSLNILGLFILV